MKLNINKIKKELKRSGRNRGWLIKKTGASRQLISYWFKTQSLSGAERIAKALDMSPRDLIK